jgi:hemolysin III
MRGKAKPGQEWAPRPGEIAQSKEEALEMEWLYFREPISAWTHGVWALLTLPGTWLLWHRAQGDWTKRGGGLVYGLSLFLCFSSSFLYHAARLSEGSIDMLNTLDHLSIYVLIAGTATPIALVVLDGNWRPRFLASIWLMALSGAAVQLALGRLPPWLATSCYLSVGWVGCVMYGEVVRKLSHRKIRLLWLGGLFYTLGAVINLRDWPELLPNFFGAHEVFHLFVMAGSLCHYCFTVGAVLTYEQAQLSAELLIPAYRRRRGPVNPLGAHN